MQNAAKAYLKTQVNTVSPGKLLIMLYDGAIKYLTQAKDKIRDKDYASKGILISKAIDIISELDESLNAQKGGQIAENLHGLYFYCNTRLLKANMDMDAKIIDEVMRVLESIKGAFMEITGQQQSAEIPAPEPPAAGPQAGYEPKPGQRAKPAETPEAPPAKDPTPGPARVKPLPGAYGRLSGYK